MYSHERVYMSLLLSFRRLRLITSLQQRHVGACMPSLSRVAGRGGTHFGMHGRAAAPAGAQHARAMTTHMVTSQNLEVRSLASIMPVNPHIGGLAVAAQLCRMLEMPRMLN